MALSTLFFRLGTFRNLSVRERILQLYRFLSCIITLILIITTLVSSVFTAHVYIARINCQHLDVSYGLYKSLRNSVSSNPVISQNSNDYVLPVDSSLTNSEISILTSYAESQVFDAPQYVLTSFWSWCYGNFNVTISYTPRGKKKITKHHTTVTCPKHSSLFLYDYRSELEQIGLSSILAYAYHTRKYNDQTYNMVTTKRHKQYNLVFPGLVFTGVSQLVVLIMMYILYSNRGDRKDLAKIPNFLLNIVAFISLASFLSCTISCSLITNLLYDIKQDISKSLGDFGISLHFGKVWFLLAWSTFCLSFFSMLAWVLPLWCANPPSDIDKYEETLEESLEDTSYQPENDLEDQSARKMHSSLGSRLRKKKIAIRQKFSDNKSDGSRSEGDFSDNEYQDNIFTPQVGRSAVDSYTDENELRRLGETFSRMSSFKSLNKTRRKQRDNPFVAVNENEDVTFDNDEDMKNLLYQDSKFHEHAYPLSYNAFAHYREQSYDGYANSRQASSSYGALPAGKRSRSTSVPSQKNDSSASRNFTNDSRDLLGNISLLSETTNGPDTNRRKTLHNPKNNPFLHD